MNGVELFSGWLTPSVLFCVLNLMIGTIFITSSLKPQKRQPEIGDYDEAPPPQLGRVPSFLERVKSFNISRHRSDSPGPDHHERPAEEPAVNEQEPERVREESYHMTRSKSESEPPAAPARVFRKSESEKFAAAEDRREEQMAADQRRPATTRAAGAGDEAVDEKADDFINRFRQQLKLQRLDSILRYREMLNRGAGR